MSGHPWVSDGPFGHDLEREVFCWLPSGQLCQIDSSDDAEILAHVRNHRPEMRFRLTYDGMLQSTAKDTRQEDKWAIRKQLEPQLAELWQVHPALLGYLMGYGGPLTTSMTTLDADVPIRVEQTRAQLQGFRASPSGYSYPFLPLVREGLLLTCSLDILFLRKGVPGSIRDQAGDLDNRITTLLDGLRMPKHKEEMDAAGQLEADPFHCLLEDDRLVTSMTIRTDRLLSRPDADKAEVRLIIDVVVSPTRIKMGLNSGFVAD
jgi:hypothetical protein